MVFRFLILITPSSLGNFGRKSFRSVVQVPPGQDGLHDAIKDCVVIVSFSKSSYTRPCTVIKSRSSYQTIEEYHKSFSSATEAAKYQVHLSNLHNNLHFLHLFKIKAEESFNFLIISRRDPIWRDSTELYD